MRSRCWNRDLPSSSGRTGPRRAAARLSVNSARGVYHQITAVSPRRGGYTKEVQQDLWCGPAKSTAAPAFRLAGNSSKNRSNRKRWTSDSKCVQRTSLWESEDGCVAFRSCDPDGWQVIPVMFGEGGLTVEGFVNRGKGNSMIIRRQMNSEGKKKGNCAIVASS